MNQHDCLKRRITGTNLHTLDPLSEKQCARRLCDGIRFGVDRAYDGDASVAR